MVRKFKCIKSYPGTFEGDIVEFDEKSYKLLDTFNDKTYDVFDIIYNPEYWEELRTIESLIFEAKERYPVGYKIRGGIYPEKIHTINKSDKFFTCGNGNLIMLKTNDGDIRIYENKKWLVW